MTCAAHHGSVGRRERDSCTTDEVSTLAAINDNRAGTTGVCDINGVVATCAINTSAGRESTCSQRDQVCTVSFGASAGTASSGSDFIAVNDAAGEGAETSDGVIQVTTSNSCDSCGTKRDGVTTFTATQQGGGAGNTCCTNGVKTFVTTNGGTCESTVNGQGIFTLPPRAFEEVPPA